MTSPVWTYRCAQCGMSTVSGVVETYCVNCGGELKLMRVDGLPDSPDRDEWSLSLEKMHKQLEEILSDDNPRPD